MILSTCWNKTFTVRYILTNGGNKCLIITAQVAIKVWCIKTEVFYILYFGHTQYTLWKNDVQFAHR